MGDTRHFHFDMIPSIVYELGSQFNINGIDYQMSPGLHVHKYVYVGLKKCVVSITIPTKRGVAISVLIL